MNKLDKIIVWDWAQRLFWASIGIVVFCFALAFTFDEPPAGRVGAQPHAVQCSVGNELPTLQKAKP